MTENLTTTLSSATKTVAISRDKPTAIILHRLYPSF
jgi:hypothetical protein